MISGKATLEQLQEKYPEMGFKHCLSDEQIKEIEQEHRYPVPSDEHIEIKTEDGLLPFGDRYFMWREMKKSYEKGDGYIWYYNNIGILCGRAGYMLVKGDFQTGWNICTMMA